MQLPSVPDLHHISEGIRDFRDFRERYLIHNLFQLAATKKIHIEEPGSLLISLSFL